MFFFILKVLILLLGLALMGVQFVYWIVKSKRAEINQMRLKLAAAWVILLLIFLLRITILK
jgi:putative copper export protein